MSKDARDPAICQPAPTLDPIPGIIPARGITLLTGPPNIGKTALLAGLAQRLRDQLPIFGHQPSPLPGLGIVIADRSWEWGAGAWFERAGFPDIPHYCLSDDPAFDPRLLRKKWERTARWAECIDKLRLPPDSLIITDPMGLFLGGNLNDYDTCAVACHEIRVLLRQRRYSLLASAHTAKLKADPRSRYLRAQDQILGSSALLGFTDTQMYLATPEETGLATYTFAWAPHMRPAESFQLVRTETGLFVPASGDRTVDRILALVPLDGSAITLGQLVELAQTYPLSDKTVRRGLDQLVADGRVERVGRGQYRRSVRH